ncbi:MAG: CopG family transcriptional regulator, partial [Variovorax sp.]
LYVRYFLTVSLPVPEGQQDAARAQGRARYTQFIEQLARHIQRGRSLVREVHEDIEPADAAQVGSGTESQEVHSESA